jgi:hypothetical protein
LASFGDLVLKNQEFVVEIGRHLAFLEPSFPTNREGARCSNEMFYDMNPGIPNKGIEAIKFLCEEHN